MKQALNIGLMGYGKMGKEIEQILQGRGHQTAFILDKNQKITPEMASNCDVVIEFTEPLSAVENIQTCLQLNLPIVVGTTGWYDAYPTVRSKVIQHHGCLFTATNFSLGVHLFFLANQYLAHIMNSNKDYEVRIEEIHHTQKKDAPSGTAITTAERIMSRYYKKTQWHCPQQHPEHQPTPPSHDSLMITAIREHDVPGTHTVLWESPIDTIEIKHTAHLRKGFATGAVIAAEWCFNKKGVFQMEDMMTDLISTP
jgi:4-hydroxy-tetrahydrodipicolinate reductase